jgi:hypothetical protein
VKRAVIACALLLSGTFAAQAWHTTDTYHDLVRPNGQPRSDAVFQADLNFCYGQSGASRNNQDTPAFKQCMLGRKWQWQSVRIVGSPSRASGRGGVPDTFGPSSDVPAAAPAPDTSYVAPAAPTPDNPNCGGGLC